MNEKTKTILKQLPGWIASILMILLTTFWTFWGVSEMYHEGWWGAWTNRLPYLAPVALTLIPTLIAFRWPLVGGVLISAVGIFALFMFAGNVAFIGLVIALLGGAFILEGIFALSKPLQDAELKPPGWQRYWRTLLVLGLPLVVMLSVSIYMLPVVLTRQDDGLRTARQIDGNGVMLVWAPEGPGWNWKQDWGGYPSWQAIALYGLPPLGLGDKPGYGRQAEGSEKTVYASAEDMQAHNLCRFLAEDGLALMDQPQDIWRMPTADELVRSLALHGENAGCTWDGQVGQQALCEYTPDKESPLWATDHAAIYYWTADSHTQEMGVFVSYNGWVNAAMKTGGNPRHSYRCVRQP